MIIAGIDEAGRGPLIGPLVVAGVKIADEKKLEGLGIKDSKLLSPRQRELLFDKVKEIVDQYSIIKVSPQEIDETLGSDSSNLNWLEADCTAEILNELQPEKAIVDAPSNNIPKYTAYLKDKLDKETDLVVEHKADFNYVVVSAASILAKVTRDREIEKIKKEIGINFGSGYPSDPLTQKFLHDHYSDFPDIFRKSWESYKKVLKKKEQSSLGDF